MKIQFKSSTERFDVYSAITNQIISAIENGVGEMQMSWHCKGFNIARPSNVLTKKSYNGVNILALWVAAHVAG